ncbi:MAG: AgmX/PglI C-terminal domain-containing protein [Deltaproteobacteria bacterium]|nr:AgmX/PglI C-terminal domain-containing protein [Deltaproteobacteria bacterium]
MKNKMRMTFLLVSCVMLLMAMPAMSQPEGDDDKTLSPYFFVQTDDPSVDQLPLKSTSVDVNVSGVIADVVVTQVYKNEGKRPIEAIYVFPASTKAAVYGMKMTIGERTIIAKIKKSNEARQEYEAAKEAGQSASLLEQQRPNVFQMNVANILPNDTITVELRYMELLVPTDKVYEFVFPTVVGPRYSNKNAADVPPSEKWISNPYLHEGEAPTSTFSLSMNLNAGLPIQEITCSTHKVNIRYQGPDKAGITLDETEKQGSNRDFILQYRLAGARIESGLLLYKGEDENYFLLMLQPPERFTTNQIPPREYIFIVDISGSMHGFPLDISKRLLKDLISGLRPTDRFNVLLFAGSSFVMSERSLPADQKNIQRAIDVIEHQRGGGGTELLPALKRALALPGTEGFSRNIIIATDGYVSVEEEAFDVIRNGLGDANMFAFGIGSSVNRHLIEGMARVGMGEPFVVTRPEEAASKADKLRELIQSPLLTNIQIDYGKFKVYDMEPPAIPDLLAERPLVVFGKYRGQPRGEIEITGLTGENDFQTRIDVSDVEPMTSNLALRYLWARHRIAVLSDYNQLRSTDERVREVTNLGLTYNLLTAYTSFIAVDSEKRLVNDQATTVNQPLPLPQGVSNYAVGRGGVFSRVKASSPAQPFVETLAGSPRVMKEVDTEEKASHDASRPVPSDKVDVQLYLKLGKVTASSKVLKEAITQLVEKELKTIRACYQVSQGMNSGETREMTITLTIDSKGHVIKARMGEKAKDKKFEECIINQLKTLTFPSPSSGKAEEITIVLVLKA